MRSTAQVGVAILFAVCLAGCSTAQESASTTAATSTPIAVIVALPTPILKESRRRTIVVRRSAPRVNERNTLRRLILDGDNLYSRALKIVDATPSTESEASAEVDGNDGPAGRFYLDERAYKNQLDAIKPFTLKNDDAAYQADFILIGVDPWLYGAVQSAMTCNASDARLNLRVAAAILMKAHAAINGADENQWSPPEVDPDGNVECSS